MNNSLLISMDERELMECNGGAIVLGLVLVGAALVGVAVGVAGTIAIVEFLNWALK